MLFHVLPLATTTRPRDSPLRDTETGVVATGDVVDTRPEVEATEPMEHRVSQPNKWPTLNLLSRYCY